MNRSKGLTRSKPLSRGSSPKRRRGVSPASKEQRAKVQDAACIVTGHYWTSPDPAHLCKRSNGGCDDPLCVVPLRRDIHRAFDDGEFDLLPYLRPREDRRRWLPELQHALDHYDGDLIGLLQRLTGSRL